MKNDKLLFTYGELFLHSTTDQLILLNHIAALTASCLTDGNANVSGVSRMWGRGGGIRPSQACGAVCDPTIMK